MKKELTVEEIETIACAYHKMSDSIKESVLDFRNIVLKITEDEKEDCFLSWTSDLYSELARTILYGKD